MEQASHKPLVLQAVKVRLYLPSAVVLCPHALTMCVVSALVGDISIIGSRAIICPHSRMKDLDFLALRRLRMH